MPLLVNDSTWGGLASPGASDPKSISGVEGTTELCPAPETGTLKALLPSALLGLFTVRKPVNAADPEKGGH